MLLQELFALKLKLELYGVKDSSNMLHHMCHTKFDGGFEKKLVQYSVVLIVYLNVWYRKTKLERYPNYRIKYQIQLKLKMKKSQDKNLDSLFDDTDSSDSDCDDDFVSDDDDDSSDNDSSSK